MSIQSLRDRSEGVISKIIIGLIVVVFGLFGFGQITTYLAPVPKVAEVNGDDITLQEMEVAVERNRRLMMAQNQTVDEDLLRTQVLQNLITRKLLLQEADRLGLYFSEQDIDLDIVSTPAFQLDGVFSADQFQLVIGSAGYSPVGYRAEMKTDKKLQQLAAAIQGSAFLTREDIKRSSALAQQTRDVAYLRIDVDDLIPEVEVTPDEVAAYYADNPASFMTEETVKLSYIEIRRDDLEQKVDVDEEALQAFFEETRAIYSEEEARRLAHILIEVNDEVPDAEARAKIEAIYQRIMDGENFEALAKTLSEDRGSAAEGGDLGFNPRGTFVEPFEEAAYALELNQLTRPVKTEFGYHIIKLLGLEEARVPEFAEVRDEVLAAYREAEAESKFIEVSGELSELAFEAPDLNGPAQDLGLELKTTDFIGRNEENGIGAEPAVIEAAFSPDVLLDGNNSRILELTPNHHVVIHVDDHRPQEVRPLAEVTAEITRMLAEEKASALAESRAQEIVAMLESGSVTRFVADKFGLEWVVVGDAGRNQSGMDREINAEVFKLPRPPEGQKSVGYAVLSDGDAAVMTVTRITDKPDDGSDLSTLGRILANQQGAYEFTEFRENLASLGDVERSN